MVAVKELSVCSEIPRAAWILVSLQKKHKQTNFSPPAFSLILGVTLRYDKTFSFFPRVSFCCLPLMKSKW